MNYTEQQFEMLYEIEQTCFPAEWSREMFRAELENPLAEFVAAQCGGGFSGFALGHIAADEGELYQIGVLPQYRGRGIAAGLLAQLHERLRQRGAAQCFLEVRSRNAAAIALYERCGYEKISVRRGYYGDDDALIYRISL